MRDFHVEAMDALMRYKDEPLDPATGDAKTLTACIAEAIVVAVKEEREACARVISDENRRQMVPWLGDLAQKIRERVS